MPKKHHIEIEGVTATSQLQKGACFHVVINSRHKAGDASDMATSTVAVDGFLYSPEYPLTMLSGRVRADLVGGVSCVPGYLFGPSKS